MRLFDLFDPEKMVKKDIRNGTLPSARQAYSKSLSMAWPSAIESVLIALISSVDTIMVGKLGYASISAVGITTQPRMILLAFIMTLNLGITAVVARRKGQKDIEGAKKTLKQGLAICFFLSLTLNILGEIFARELLTFAGAKKDYIDMGVTYFRIILIGNFFSCMSLTMTAAQRGYGNTRISMITNVTANLVNVLFNFLLINGIWIFPKLGVTGAAIATTIGNIIAFMIALYSVMRRDVPMNIHSKKNDNSWKFDKNTMSSVGKVWSASLVEQVFLRVGFFTYASMVASLGTLEFATHQICMNLINITFSCGDGFSVASTSLVGQSLGENRPDLAIMYANISQRCVMILGMIIFTIIMFLRIPIVMLYSDEAPVIELGSKIMMMVAVISLFQTSSVVLVGCLRGSGDTKYVAFSSFICIGIIRPLVSYLLCYPMGMGLIGAWTGLFIDQVARLIFYYTRFKSGKWTKIKL